MKIVFDNVIYSLQKIGGNSVYWTELITRFQRDFGDNVECYEYMNAIHNHIRSRYKFNNLTVLPSHYLFFKRYMPLHIEKRDPFIFHSSYYRNNDNVHSKNVVTVHDFIYEKFDKGIKKLIHSIQKKRAINAADIVICISESTKKDLLNIYPQFKHKDIRVIYNGVGDKFIVLNKVDKDLKLTSFSELSDCKYILVVGNRVGCKNFKLVIQTFNFIYKSFKLVLVGQPLNENEKKEFLEPSLANVYTYLGLSDEELNLLYNNAFCLLFPSQYEGFGIPVIEAMKAGCPVITTSYSSLPEICLDTALYLKDMSVNSVLEELNKLKNPNLRNDIIKKGLGNSKRFSWENTYQSVLSIYKELLNEK